MAIVSTKSNSCGKISSLNLIISNNKIMSKYFSLKSNSLLMELIKRIALTALREAFLRKFVDLLSFC